jgi:hypothetical protein
MDVQEEPEEVTQTTPQGAEIPVPSKDEFFENLRKVAPKVERDDQDDD